MLSLLLTCALGFDVVPEQPKFKERPPTLSFPTRVIPKFKQRKIVVAPRVILWSDTADEKASWCAPCRVVKPIAKKLINQGWPIEMHYLDVERETYDGWVFSGVPALQIIAPDGKEIARTTPGSEQGIVDFLTKHGISLR